MNQTEALEMNYYEILEVSESVTTDELKAAYVRLALLYHPDTKTSTDSHTDERFVLISEAWSVLSKPDLRKKYDLSRRRLSGYVGTHENISVSNIDASTGYSTQRDNFAMVQHKASSNWKDLKDKYKTEQWQNMALIDKKNLRRRPVSTVSASVLLMTAPIVFATLLSFGYYRYTFNKK